MTQPANTRPVGKFVTASLKAQLAKLPHSNDRSSEMFRGFSKESQDQDASGSSNKPDHKRK